MFAELSNDIDNFITVSQHYLPFMLKALFGLWLFNIANWATGSWLNLLGIRPRTPIGLMGILFAPFLHSGFTHLLFNSVPLLFLGLFVLSMGLVYFYWATALIVVFSGLGVWLIGRRGVHIGASGLISGYFGYIVASAYQQPTFTTFFCALIALYYFGGILFSLFPSEETTSWEGHLTGFLSGLLSVSILHTNYINFLIIRQTVG